MISHRAVRESYSPEHSTLQSASLPVRRTNRAGFLPDYRQNCIRLRAAGERRCTLPGSTAKVAVLPACRSHRRSRARAEHSMSLSAFIRDHHEEIISEFAVFAKTLMPPGADMTEAELRDHAEEILAGVV